MAEKVLPAPMYRVVQFACERMHVAGVGLRWRQPATHAKRDLRKSAHKQFPLLKETMCKQWSDQNSQQHMLIDIIATQKSKTSANGGARGAGLVASRFCRSSKKPLSPFCSSFPCEACPVPCQGGLMVDSGLEKGGLMVD